MKSILKSSVRLAFRLARKTHKLAVKLGAYEPDPVWDREDVIAHVGLGLAACVASMIMGAAFGFFGLEGAFALPLALLGMTYTVRAVDTVADKLFPAEEQYDPYYEYEDVEVVDLDV